jgi:acyl carrier protein
MADPLTELVASTLEIPEEQVSDTMSRDTDGAWTSLKHLQLAAAVEDAFRVSLTPREIGQIGSVGDLRKLLRALGAPA